MRLRGIYKACNYGVIDLNKGEDIITCLLLCYVVQEEGKGREPKGRNNSIIC